MRTPWSFSARTAVAALVLATLGGLTACSGADSESSSAGDSGGMSAPEPASAAQDEARDSAGSREAVNRGSGEVRSAVIRSTSVIRVAEISLTSKDIASVRAKIDDLLTSVGGSVDQDETTTDRRGRINGSMLVLRVPVAQFDAVQEDLQRLGTLRSSTETGKDVTTEVIDVAERVQTLRNSLDRLQRFQRTSNDVDDLIRYETEITRRQSELQSLEAQQAYLADQTSKSTIRVHLSRPGTSAEPGGLDDAGFLAGLQAGWRALLGFLVVAVTVVGALLPFAVVALLVGVPVWLGLRALLRRRRAPATPATEAVS